MSEYAVAVGDPRAGRQIIRETGCGSCHTIPGIRGANGLVGPPLTSFARRTYIGGTAPNTPENLVQWVRNPQSIEPHTAMPNLGLDERQARAVAAYLYTLR
jgi:cytochrome c1